MDIIKKLEEELIRNYEIGEIVDREVNRVCWNTNYVFKTKSQKYFVKTFVLNEGNNNSLEEIKICNYLRSKGYPVSQFIKNIHGEYISNLDSRQKFHVQQFIEGDIWKKNTAPDWLLEKGIFHIAKIHNELKNFKLKVRPSIKLINDKEFHINRIENIINEITKIKDLKEVDFFIEDLENRRNVIFNSENIDLSKLTFVNGHSDYSITQIITSGTSIVGIIDMTEVSSVPSIWELIRFFLNSSKEFREGKVNVASLKRLLSKYMDICTLSRYDLYIMHKLNYLYMCQAVSVYEKLIRTKDEKFKERAKVRIEKINNFYKCQSDLNNIAYELGESYKRDKILN